MLLFHAKQPLKKDSHFLCAQEPLAPPEMFGAIYKCDARCLPWQAGHTELEVWGGRNRYPSLNLAMMSFAF